MGDTPLARLAVMLGVALAATAARADAEKPSPPVSMELWETHVTFDAAGKLSIQTRDVYRVLDGNPPPWYSSVYREWKPSRDDPPVLDATVTRPDGTVVKLDPATVSDQPLGRDDLVFHDRKRRMAPLPGLAVGAVVERRTSATRPPELAPGNDDAFTLSWDVPTKKRLVVVEVPAGAPFHWKVTGGPAIKPRRQERDGRVTWIFEAEVPAAHVPTVLAPRATHEAPTLYVSTMRSWQTVAAAWAARADARIDVDEARALAKEITKDLTDRDAKAKAILAWMSANLRYTGVELGDADWTPARTHELLDRRYGDCKDLSLLLIALLRASGVEADMALVAVEYGEGPQPETPGLRTFDHAVVHMGGGPPVWLDATQPFQAYGEATWLAGRLALVTRPDSTALTRIETRVRSRLDAQADVFMADAGRARLRMVTQIDGYYFADLRTAAAQRPADYRSATERFARETWRAEKPIRLDLGDAFAAGPFRETIDVPDASVGVTSGTEATAVLVTSGAFGGLQWLETLEKRGVLAQRSEPIELPSGMSARVVTTVHPPDGFRVAELPDDLDARAGPIHLTMRATSHDGIVEGVLELEVARANLAADDARRFLHDVMPAAQKFTITLHDGVFDDMDHRKPYTAARNAAATVAAHPTAANRARFADALGGIGLVEAAAREAHRALAEAPDDPLVRNRAAYALSFNERGASFEGSFARAEVLALTTGTIAKRPDDEWARRMQIVAERTVPSANLDALAKEINEYRARTGGTSLDRELISVRLEQRAWKELAAECPKLSASSERDAACLAADLANGGAAAAARAGGAGKAAITGAAIDLALAREYDVLQSLAALSGVASSSNPAIQLLAKLRRSAIPSGDVKEPMVQLLRALVEGRLADASRWLDPPGPLTPEERRASRGFLGALRSFPCRPWQLSAFMSDVIASVATVEVHKLEGFGDLVTLALDYQGGGTKVTILVRRTPKGYRIAMREQPAIAAEALRVLNTQRERATTLFQTLKNLGATPEMVRTKLDSADTAPFAAAVIAARDAKTRPLALSWLDEQLGRSDLTGDEIKLIGLAYLAVLPVDPARVVAAGRRLQTLPGAELQRTGVELELRGLGAQGAFGEARTRFTAEIAARGSDAQLERIGEGISLSLGEFAAYRDAAARHAAAASGKAAANDLNNAAWYSIFAKTDATARAQAERAVELNPSAAYLNTLAAVYVELGLWDEAVVAFQRELAAEADAEEDEHHKGYYWVRGRIAEAVGEPAVAAAMYRKIVREKNGGAGDVYLLAAPRLKALTPSGP